MQDLSTVAPADDQVKPAGRRPKRRHASEDLFAAYAVDGALPDRNEALVQLYPFLLRSAKNHLAPLMGHHDIAQLASLVFLRSFPRHLPDRERGVWHAAARLCAAARSLALSPSRELKRSGTTYPLERDKVDARAREPVEQLAVPDQVEAMLAALGETDEAYAEALRLRYLEERGVGEIASEIDLPEGQVNKMLDQARKALRKRYDVVYVAPPSRVEKERLAVAERERLREERRQRADELARQGYSACAIARLLGASRGLSRRAVYRVRGQVVAGM